MFDFRIEVAGEILRVITHNMAHLDEVVAICAVKWFGNMEFLDKYCRGGDDSLCSALYLGVNGGAGDEHPISGKPFKKKGKCCAILIAKALKFEDEKFQKFKKILEFTKKNDVDGYTQGGCRDIASVLNLLHRQHQDKENQLDNLEWMINAIWLKYEFDYENDDFTIDHIAKVAQENQNQIHFNADEWLDTGTEAIRQGQIDFLAAVEEYKSKEKAGEILTAYIPFWLKKKKKTVQLKIVALKSDSYKMVAAAKSKKGGSANFVIIQNSKGNISVLSNGWPSFHETAAILRYEEQKKNSLIITDDWRELASEGTVEGANIWYFYKNINALLNGGFTHPETSPTKLSIKEIIRAVCLGLDKQAYRWTGCKKGQFCAKKFCPYYPWGLDRCKDVRYALWRKKLIAA
ncbi:hypothetical protein KAU09_01600 [Candidatus Parcubacteria bacterium]|nr:hypothetical protein [Candidatus Parcubacteria bacterium]